MVEQGVGVGVGYTIRPHLRKTDSDNENKLTKAAEMAQQIRASATPA